MTAIVFFILGYFTHKYKDTMILKLQEAIAKIQAIVDSKR